MTDEPIAISGPPTSGIQFTVGTLMTKPDEYQEMVASFKANGFTGPDCEYLYVDNSTNNQFDGFSGLEAIIAAARGRYVILVHQDVVLLDDDRTTLLTRLDELDRKDPNWALAGNSGGFKLGQLVTRLTDPHETNRKMGDFPSQVCSLDENFIVLKRSMQLAPSRNIGGFHLYGTDLCLQAALRGLTAYVVDFHLNHKSAGTYDHRFIEARDRFERVYKERLQTRLVQSTCDIIILSGSSVWLPVLQLLRRLIGRIASLRPKR